MVQLFTDYSGVLHDPSYYKHSTAVIQVDAYLGYGMWQSPAVLVIPLLTIITCVETTFLHLLQWLGLMPVTSLWAPWIHFWKICLFRLWTSSSVAVLVTFTSSLFMILVWCFRLLNCSFFQPFLQFVSCLTYILIAHSNLRFPSCLRLFCVGSEMNISFKTFAATWFNIVFSGDQPR
jgi:hypothetical protein